MADDANTQSLALDYSACVREQAQIGHTVIHNICDGRVSSVPWGNLDWLGFFGMGGLVGVMALILCALLALLAHSVFSDLF